MAKSSRHMTPTIFGFETFADLFTPRQLVALTTFSDLVLEARAKALEDAQAAGLEPDQIPLLHRIEIQACVFGKQTWIECAIRSGARRSQWSGIMPRPTPWLARLVISRAQLSRSTRFSRLATNGLLPSWLNEMPLVGNYPKNR
jgi:hypothetical protein